MIDIQKMVHSLENMSLIASLAHVYNRRPEWFNNRMTFNSNDTGMMESFIRKIMRAIYAKTKADTFGKFSYSKYCTQFNFKPARIFFNSARSATLHCGQFTYDRAITARSIGRTPNPVLESAIQDVCTYINELSAHDAESGISIDAPSRLSSNENFREWSLASVTPDQFLAYLLAWETIFLKYNEIEGMINDQ